MKSMVVSVRRPVMIDSNGEVVVGLLIPLTIACRTNYRTGSRTRYRMAL